MILQYKKAGEDDFDSFVVNYMAKHMQEKKEIVELGDQLSISEIARVNLYSVLYEICDRFDTFFINK